MITLKDFAKLPQLDRIEFRQQQNEIFKIKSNNLLSFLLALIFIIPIVSIMIGLSSGRYEMLEFLYGINNAIPFILMSVVLLVFTDIATMIYKYKKHSELLNHYFKVKVEVKKNGRTKKTKK